MDNIKDVVQQVVGRIANKQQDKSGKLERIWQNVLEDHERDHTQLIGIRNGSILVHVDSPALKYHMSLKKRKLIKALNDESLDVKDVQFKIGKIK